MSEISDLLQNAIVIELFNQNNIPLTEENIKKNRTILLEYLADCKLDCHNTVKPCKRIPWGYKKTLQYINNRFYLVDDYCEHYLKAHPFEKIRSNILYQNNNLENFKGSLMQIKKENDERPQTDPAKEVYDKILSVLEKLVNDKNMTKGIYVFGEPGVGKTYLYKALSIEYALRGRKVLLTTVENLLANLKKALANSEAPRELTIEMCKKADVLILDDIGVERVSKWSRDEVLYSILDYRYENKKITYFGSNVSLDGLRIHFGKPSDAMDLKVFDTTGVSRVVDRIKGLYNFEIKIPGKSRR